MHSQTPIEIGDGQTFLIIVQGDRVVEYTWAMMPHVEFVNRTVGKLADDAWVGTVSKIDGENAAISSKTFYGVPATSARVGCEGREVCIQVT